MNWFGNEYLVPIIIGNGKDERAAARAVRRLSGAFPYIFAEKFGFGQRFYATCRKVSLSNDDILCMSICDFADGIEEYMLPVLIYGKEFEDFVKKYSDSLEERLVLCDISHALELLQGR